MTSLPTLVNNVETYLKNPESCTSPIVTNTIHTKIPKLYGSYSKLQQEKVISFIRNGNSLRSAEKVFGIPKSTLHCWLKKLDSSFIKESPDVITKLPSSIPSKNLLQKNNFSDSFSTNIQLLNLKKRIKELEEKSQAKEDKFLEEECIIHFLKTRKGIELVAKAYNIPVDDFIIFVTQFDTKRNVGELTDENEKKCFKGLNTNQITECYKHMTAVDPNIDLQNQFRIVKSKKMEDDECCRYLKRALTSAESDYDSKIFPKKSRKVIQMEKSPVLETPYIHNPEHQYSNSAMVIEKQSSMNTRISEKILQVPPVSDSLSGIECEYPFVAINDKVAIAMNDKVQLLPNYLKATAETNVNSLEEKPIGFHLEHLIDNCNEANLNIINRTESEIELMALVDGENVTADELYTEFNYCDLKNWIDNESWYIDQYLQHFLVNPAELCNTDCPATNDIKEEFA